MTTLKVLGLDPSLSNLGMVCGDLCNDSGGWVLTINDLNLIETKPTKAKQLRKNSDDLTRARLLVQAVKAAERHADLIMVEVPHGSQSARAMASYGVSIGVIAAIDPDVPVIQLTATEVKMAALNNKTASKDDMIEWAVNRHPSAPWLMRGGKVTKKNEHLADAVAAIEAGILTDDFKMMARAISLSAAKPVSC